MNKASSFFKNLFSDELDEFIKSASDEEVKMKYEEYRQKWMNSGFGGNGERSREMETLNKEILRRAEKKMGK